MVSKFFLLGASSHMFISYAYTRHYFKQIPFMRTSFTSDLVKLRLSQDMNFLYLIDLLI